jgi:hypothetical protein
MKYNPNEQTSPSLWRRMWDWLVGEDKTAHQPTSLRPRVVLKPEIRLSSEQHSELTDAMDLPSPNDTNFLPSDTAFRSRKASSGGETSVII